MAQDIKPDELGLDLELKDELPGAEVKPEDIEVVHTRGEPIPEVERPERKDGENRAEWRIRQKHFEKSQAERDAEEARRQRDGAMKAAETYRIRAQQLEQQNTQMRQLATSAVGANLDSEISKAEAQLTAAFKTGSAEQVTEWNSKLMELRSKKVAFENGAQQYAQQAAPAGAQGSPQAPAVPIHPETADYPVARQQWQQQNANWFQVTAQGQPVNEDSKKILQVEANLVRSGLVRGSSAYWRGIQTAVSQIRGTGTPTAATGSSRSAAGNGQSRVPAGRKQVELSEDERRAAVRLGVSEKDYALEKWKILQSQGE